MKIYEKSIATLPWGTAKKMVAFTKKTKVKRDLVM